MWKMQGAYQRGKADENFKEVLAARQRLQRIWRFA